MQSTVRGPAIIGRGAVIENAYVGPFTVDRRRRDVRGSEVEHSIILEGSSVDRRGRPHRVEPHRAQRRRIYRTATKPRSFNFMLGDRSEVGLI